MTKLTRLSGATTSRLLLAAALLAPVAAAGPAAAQTVIVNKEDRPNPWVINGCTIAPKTVCKDADLRHADLKEADLSGANLARADLRHAHLRGARLDGANLAGAKLQIVFMQGASARKASFVGADFDHGRIAGADFSGSDFTVYLTHIHTDHVLGATAFEPSALWTTPELAADLKARGAGLTDAMYRVAGDWMRGTTTPEPAQSVTAEHEDVGERRFRFLTLGGHSGSDLCLFEERSGLLIAGDLVFLDRAATTPDADLPRWRASLGVLADLPHKLVVPGHGPAEAGRRGFDQTRAWLAMVEETIANGFERGLDVTELMAAPLPDWTARIAVARYEFSRSVMHLMPAYEATRLPKLEG